MLLNDEFIKPDPILSRSTTLSGCQELAVYMNFHDIVALLTLSLLSWPRPSYLCQAFSLEEQIWG